ncbi:MAG: hypothetical protein GX616_22395 [Planctomycetes bacterium]|nr:hypothetical protein [Planctomycetota bacterium]
MDEESTGRFEVVVEWGLPRGDLYELEQFVTFQVVEKRCNRVIMAFESKMEASLSSDTGLWDDYVLSGVSDVRIAADEQSVIVTYHDGTVESVPLVAPAQGAGPPHETDCST